MQSPSLLLCLPATCSHLCISGTAEPPPGWRKDTALPFLFDIDSMPTRDTVCPHCPAVEKPPICCGVCIFESRLCEQYYPRQNKSEAVAQQLLDSGYQLRVRRLPGCCGACCRFRLSLAAALLPIGG